LETPVTPRVLPPQSTVTPSSTAPDTQALLPVDEAALELALLEDELEATLELELDLLDEELDATLELDLLEELLLVAVGPTEHHALESKLFDGNSEVEQVKLPVSVA
jgi:hypothetical protein